MTELSASAITSDALTMLRAQGARVRRVNNVGAYRGRKNQVEAGWPDVEGYSCKGVVIICEIKKIGDTLSKEQKERLLDCEKCGGIALVATQVNGTTKLFKISDYLLF